MLGRRWLSELADLCSMVNRGQRALGRADSAIRRWNWIAL